MTASFTLHSIAGHTSGLSVEQLCKWEGVFFNIIIVLPFDLPNICT